MDLKKKFAEVGIPLGTKPDEDKLPYVHVVAGQEPYKKKYFAPMKEVNKAEKEFLRDSS